MEDQPFLDTIYEHPMDPGPRLVYADWLEEQGRTLRAELLRLEYQAGEILGHENMMSHVHSEKLRAKAYNIPTLRDVRDELFYGMGTIRRATAHVLFILDPYYGKYNKGRIRHVLLRYKPVKIRCRSAVKRCWPEEKLACGDAIRTALDYWWKICRRLLFKGERMADDDINRSSIDCTSPKKRYCFDKQPTACTTEMTLCEHYGI